MMQPVRRALLSLTLLATLTIAACGEGPTAEPTVGRPVLDPTGEPYTLPGGGQIDLPATWDREQGPPTGPELVRSYSGQGTVVVWQYPRTEPLPTTNRTLRKHPQEPARGDSRARSEVPLHRCAAASRAAAGRRDRGDWHHRRRSSRDPQPACVHRRHRDGGRLHRAGERSGAVRHHDLHARPGIPHAAVGGGCPRVVRGARSATRRTRLG